MKTGEALDGIGRVIDKDVPTAAAYLELVRSLNPTGLRTYPGSPAIVRAFLRESERLTACELREDDAALLRANFRDDRRVSVHCRDGYEALGALLPHRFDAVLSLSTRLSSDPTNSSSWPTV